jgi:hypothetical protein
VDAIVDEKGTIHCQTDDGVWCPFSLLAVEWNAPQDMDVNPSFQRNEEDEGPTSQPEDPRADRDFEGGF